MSDNQRSVAGAAVSTAIAVLLVAFLGVALWAGFNGAPEAEPTAEVSP